MSWSRWSNNLVLRTWKFSHYHGIDLLLQKILGMVQIILLSKSLLKQIACMSAGMNGSPCAQGSFQLRHMQTWPHKRQANKVKMLELLQHRIKINATNASTKNFSKYLIITWITNLSRVRKYCIRLSNHFEKPISILVNLLGDFLPESPFISTFTSCQELASLNPTQY